MDIPQIDCGPEQEWITAVQGSDRWHSMRSERAVTASVAGDILGVGYGSRANLWTEKTTGVRVHSDFVKELMANGTSLEPVVLRKLSESGLFDWVLPPLGSWVRGLYSASPDGFVYLRGELYLLEIKTCKNLPAKPRLGHLVQTFMQSHCATTPGTPPLPVVLAYAWMEDPRSMNVFIVDFRRMDDYRATWAWMHKMWAEFAECVERKEPPGHLPRGTKERVERELTCVETLAQTRGWSGNLIPSRYRSLA